MQDAATDAADVQRLGDSADTHDGSLADAGATEAGPSANGFTFVRSEAAACPLSAADCASDWPATGTVRRWTSTERYRTRTHERTAWMYRPAGTEGRALPLLVFLHGGNGNGAAMFSRAFDELARGESVSWRRATSTCTFSYPNGFRDGAGARCTPETVTYRGAEPFALLFPEGIESASTRIPNARHWEDGRSPSPGQLSVEETRDDVGFIAHLLELAAREAGGVDPERIYLAGWSNGGMMTQRVLCEIESAGREPLRALAAVAVGIAALPANLYDGTEARPRCPRTSTALPSIYFQVGRGIATPDCASFPCMNPIADGDGTMPFATPGARHRVNSPDLGFVQSFADTLELFRASLAASYGAETIEPPNMIGAHTAEQVRTLSEGRVELRSLVTDGGAHETVATRGEFASEARQWRFLAGFRRRAGRVERRAETSVMGSY